VRVLISLLSSVENPIKSASHHLIWTVELIGLL
jgi:hypothetical protein